ncbi:MAG: sigma 54-interacting transcriptional regulator [Rikenellaceae bacterium]
MELGAVKQRFGIIGHSELLDRALEVALRVASTDFTVLVSGESGVGKEFFPQVIHAYSSRKHNRYIAVNCGAIPEGTIDSELFGHEKGAFTGATEMRRGYFEEANGGTIFLDEVGELPLSTQVRLLRVLQSGEFIRVGSTKVQKSDVRVIAATNRVLNEAIEDGRFREDLYYRLSTVPITVPALRERREDINLLFKRFALDVANRYRMPAITLDDDARKVLESYYWRGNIRQLKNVAEQISAIETERLITADRLSSYLPDLNSVTGAVVNTPNRGGYGSDSSGFNGERELLYKVLFDMRSEMAELRRMVSQLLTDRGFVDEPIVSHAPFASPLPPSLPSHEQSVGAVKGLIESSDYGEAIESNEVEYIPREITKSDMQREAIVKALRRHNGRRKDAAAELFISERTLYRRIKELGIDEE